MSFANMLYVNLLYVNIFVIFEKSTETKSLLMKSQTRKPNHNYDSATTHQLL
jgi:hypothetical protein